MRPSYGATVPHVRRHPVTFACARGCGETFHELAAYDQHIRFDNCHERTTDGEGQRHN